MNAVNPKYVFRNYMAQLCIDDADKGDYSLLNNLFEMLKPEEYANYELRHIVQALDAAKFNNPKRRVAQGILAGSSYYQSLQDHIYEKDKICMQPVAADPFRTRPVGL